MGLSVVVACHNVAEFLPARWTRYWRSNYPPRKSSSSTTDRRTTLARSASGTPPRTTGGWWCRVPAVVPVAPAPSGSRVDQDFLAFVDGDDVVPPEGFRVLLTSLQKTGSDMAAGDVLRYDGVHLLPSGPHRNAILQTRLRTTIPRPRA